MILNAKIDTNAMGKLIDYIAQQTEENGTIREGCV